MNNVSQVGKGLTNVASQSGSSGAQQDTVSEFEFKDPAGAYTDTDQAGSDMVGTWAAPSQAHATLYALNNPSRIQQQQQQLYQQQLQTVAERWVRSYLSIKVKSGIGWSRFVFIIYPFDPRPLGKKR